MYQGIALSYIKQQFCDACIRYFFFILRNFVAELEVTRILAWFAMKWPFQERVESSNLDTDLIPKS